MLQSSVRIFDLPHPGNQPLIDFPQLMQLSSELPDSLPQLLLLLPLLNQTLVQIVDIIPALLPLGRLELGSGLHEQLVAGVLALGSLVDGDQFGHLLVAVELHQEFGMGPVLTAVPHYMFC